MKTAKLGAIFLVSVMVLAGAAAANAWWTDKLSIRGTIKTDDFGGEWILECYEFSDFIKWNELDPNGYYKGGAGTYDADGNPVGQEGVDYWQLATGTVELADCLGKGICDLCKCKTLWINLSDVFPSNDVQIQGALEWYGSCPGNLSFIDDWGNLSFDDGTWIDPVDWSDLKWIYVKVEILSITQELTDQTGLDEGIYDWCALEDLIWSQWHDGYELEFVIYIHFIQWDMIFYDPLLEEWIDCSEFMEDPDDKFDVPMNAKLEFYIDLYFEQWNYNGLTEVPPP
jgi:hypothetical protein